MEEKPQLAEISVIPLRIIPSLRIIEIDVLKTVNESENSFQSSSPQSTSIAFLSFPGFPICPDKSSAYMNKTMGLGGMTHFRTHKKLSYAISDLGNSKIKKRHNKKRLEILFAGLGAQ